MAASVAWLAARTSGLCASAKERSSCVSLLSTTDGGLSYGPLGAALKAHPLSFQPNDMSLVMGIEPLPDNSGFALQAISVIMAPAISADIFAGAVLNADLPALPTKLTKAVTVTDLSKIGAFDFPDMGKTNVFGAGPDLLGHSVYLDWFTRDGAVKDSAMRARRPWTTRRTIRGCASARRRRRRSIRPRSIMQGRPMRRRPS